MVKIEKISITVGKTKLELTLEELKELKKALDSLLPSTQMYWATYTGTDSTKIGAQNALDA